MQMAVPSGNRQNNQSMIAEDRATVENKPQVLAIMFLAEIMPTPGNKVDRHRNFIPV
ncbi:MAG: hypothetical protein NVSMB10_06180 [Steroidobacteraceae bacterium]